MQELAILARKYGKEKLKINIHADFSTPTEKIFLKFQTNTSNIFFVLKTKFQDNLCIYAHERTQSISVHAQKLHEHSCSYQYFLKVFGCCQAQLKLQLQLQLELGIALISSNTPTRPKK